MIIKNDISFSAFQAFQTKSIRVLKESLRLFISKILTADVHCKKLSSMVYYIKERYDSLNKKCGFYMDLSITLGFIAKSVAQRPDETDEAKVRRTALMLKEYGFSCFDYLIPRSDNWVDDAARFREFAESAGVKVHQSHAPVFRIHPGTSRDEALETYLPAVDAAAAIGAEYLVVHASEIYLAPGEIYDSEKAVREQIEMFLPVAERADRIGIKIACENVTFSQDEPRSRCSGTAEELLAIIEGLNGTSQVRPGNPAGCCWDFGHGRRSFEDESAKELKKVVPHLLCTHVHDNRARDDHQPPFTGKMDWPPLMKVLHDGGYRGNLSLELHYGRFPERVLPAYLNFCHAAGEELIRMATEG